MLNSGYKKSAVAACEQAGQEYKKQYENTVQSVTSLHSAKEHAKTLLSSVENLVSSISCKPLELEKKNSAISVHVENIEKEIIAIRKKSIEDERLNKGTAGAGVAAGVGVAAFGPSAAMAIANTLWNRINRYCNCIVVRGGGDRCRPRLAGRRRLSRRWRRDGRRFCFFSFGGPSRMGDWRCCSGRKWSDGKQQK